jgi:LmbE family N-acetylglucosaminyl deacetylase
MVLWSERGHKVYAVSVTKEILDHEIGSEELAEIRRAEAEEAAKEVV